MVQGALELLTFKASEAYLKDRSVLAEVFSTVSNALGCKAIYSGLQVEDKATGYILIVWESYEYHKALIEGENYGDIVARLLVGIDNTVPFELVHVPLDTNPTPPLEAAATEVVIIVPQPEKVDTVVPELKKLEQELNNVSGHAPAIFNEVREKPGTWAFVIGWDSVEAHTNAAKAPVLGGIIDRVIGSGDATATIKHVSLSKFVSS